MLPIKRSIFNDLLNWKKDPLRKVLFDIGRFNQLTGTPLADLAVLVPFL